MSKEVRFVTKWCSFRVHPLLLLAGLTVEDMDQVAECISLAIHDFDANADKIRSMNCKQSVRSILYMNNCTLCTLSGMGFDPFFFIL